MQHPSTPCSCLQVQQHVLPAPSFHPNKNHVSTLKFLPSPAAFARFLHGFSLAFPWLFRDSHGKKTRVFPWFPPPSPRSSPVPGLNAATLLAALAPAPIRLGLAERPRDAASWGELLQTAQLEVQGELLSLIDMEQVGDGGWLLLGIYIQNIMYLFIEFFYLSIDLSV